MKLSTVHSCCEARREIIAEVYKALVEYSINFDRLSKSKTIEELYPLIPFNHIDTLIDFLMANFLNSGDSKKKWFADQFVVLLRHHLNARQGHKAVVQRCLQFFCKYGFFASESLKKSDQSMLREKLFSLLSLLISDSTEVWASYTMLQIETLEEDHKRVVKLDSEIKKIRKTAFKMMKKLRAMVFNLLMLLTIAKKGRISPTSWIGNAFFFDIVTIVSWRC